MGIRAAQRTRRLLNGAGVDGDLCGDSETQKGRTWRPYWQKLYLAPEYTILR